MQARRSILTRSLVAATAALVLAFLGSGALVTTEASSERTPFPMLHLGGTPGRP